MGHTAYTIYRQSNNTHVDANDGPRFVGFVCLIAGLFAVVKIDENRCLLEFDMFVRQRDGADV